MIRIVGKEGRSKRLLQTLCSELRDIPDRIISWGAEWEGAINGGPRRDAIEQLRRFKDHGINAPDYTTDVLRAREWVADGSLVFGRRRIHTEGRDIVGPTHPRWRRSEYWVRVVPNVAQEWRIHVFQGRSIARGLKVQTGRVWRRMPVRNRANGWTMVHDQDPPKGLRTLAKHALEAVGYDFGAVDLLVGEDGRQWVLEVNKAPGVDLSTAEAYVRAFAQN